jgi:hypothetical protein
LEVESRMGTEMQYPTDCEIVVMETPETERYLAFSFVGFTPQSLSAKAPLVGCGLGDGFNRSRRSCLGWLAIGIEAVRKRWVHGLHDRIVNRGVAMHAIGFVDDEVRGA